MDEEGDSPAHPDREYLGDVFVQAWLDKQVIARTDEYLARLRGILGIVILATSAVLAIFGYQLLDLRRELIDRAGQASRDAATASADVEAARQFLTQARQLSDSTFGHVESTVALTKSNVEQSSSTVNSLWATLNGLHKQELDIATAQTALASQTAAFRAQQDAIANAFTTQREQLEALVEQAQRSVKKVLDSEGTVAGIAGSVAQVQAIYSDLLERRQVEYAFLRSHDSRIVNLYSFIRHDQSASVRRVQIMVSVDDIKDRINLAVAVVDDGSGKPGVQRTFGQLRQSETPVPIEGTPFVFRVEFIYHAKLAIDFVVVKIQASDGSA